MKKLLIIIVQTFFVSTNYAQTHTSKVLGEYYYTDSMFNAGLYSRLSLLKDGTYQYETGTHMQVHHSNGTWKLNGDTLTINSSIDSKNIPITVKESCVDSLKNKMVFKLVKNLDGEDMGALLHFNNNVSSVCDPLMGNGCPQKIGTIKNFMVEFSNEASSKWYKLRNKKANLIEVTASVHDFLSLYLYFKNERYLFKNGELQYLPRNGVLNGRVEVLKQSH